MSDMYALLIAASPPHATGPTTGAGCHVGGGAGRRAGPGESTRRDLTSTSSASRDDPELDGQLRRLAS